VTSATRKPRIAVLGSANIDWVCRVPRLPRSGETLQASSLSRYRGGKGANQAVAAARLGADVSFFGSVGADPFGEVLLEGFAENGVDASAVERPSDSSTGTATIWVAERGENAIVIAAGANGLLDRAYVDRHLDRLSDVDVLLLQFEIPIDTVRYVLRALPPRRPSVVLDPAPAAPLDDLDVGRIACITPNEEELRILSGKDDLERGAEVIHSLGVNLVICTRGAKGASILQREKPSVHIPSFAVHVIDTTAAGDAFTAALAVGLAAPTPPDLEEVIRRACAAGALAAAAAGAWPSLPSGRQVDELLDGSS
jgi:ribokinase